MANYLLYGDGLSAQIISKRRSKDKDKGVNLIEYELYPTPTLIERWGLGDKLNSNGYIKVTHPLAYSVVLSDDPKLGRELMFTNFINGETSLSNLYARYQEQIIGMEKLIQTLRNQNAYLHSKLKMETNTSTEIMKRDLQKYQEVLKLRKNKTDDEDDVKNKGGSIFT